MVSTTAGGPRRAALRHSGNPASGGDRPRRRDVRAGVARRADAETAGVRGPRAGPATVDCVVEVVQALAGVPGTDNMRQLPVLDEDRPFWAGADDFLAAMIALLERRVARFGDVLRAHVPDFGRRYSRLLEKLTALDRVPSTVIHGDGDPRRSSRARSEGRANRGTGLPGHSTLETAIAGTPITMEDIRQELGCCFRLGDN